MTRQEFLDDVNSFSDLIDFCCDERIDYCYDIYDAYNLNEILMERIADMSDWTDVRGLLRDIPTGYDYYREDGYGGFEAADDYFDDYKDEVLRHMDRNGGWDEDEEDDEEYEEYESDDAMGEDDADIDDTSFMAAVGKVA